MSIATKRRIARKERRCASCLDRIQVGHVYLMHTMFPNDDIYSYAHSHPVQSGECADCAIRYGRDWALEPFPHETQAYRYWLGDGPQRLADDPLNGLSA